LTATAVAGGVALSWSASSDDVAVTGYRVLRDDAVIGTTTTTAFTDTAVVSGTRYSYAIVAFDADGNSSKTSTAATVTALDTEPPTAPTALTATASGAGRVELAWSASSDDVGVTGYRVLRDGAELATTSATAFTDSTVAAGTSYTYQVAARDAAGNNSPPSESVAVTTAAVTTTYTFRPTDDASIVSGSTSNLGAAKILETDASPQKAFLLRFSVTSIGSGTVTDARLRLHVTNSSNRGGDVNLTAVGWSERTVTWATAPPAGTRVGSLAAVSAGTWKELPLAAGAVSADGSVNFRVDSTSSDGAAYDSKEAGSILAPQLILTVSYEAPDTEPPTPPAGLVASAPSSNRVELAWTAATDDRGVTEYVIRRDGVEIASVTGTTHSDTTVVPDTGYTYQVSARDAAGNVSPPSNAASVTTPPPDRTLTFRPTDDASIVSGSTSNLGAAKTLETDASPQKAFLLRFSVSGVGAGTVMQAKLRLHVTNPSNRGGDFNLTTAGWSESTVTWATAPAPGTRVGSLTAVPTGAWTELPLAAGAVSGDGSVNLRVDSTSSDGAAYDSKEAGATLAPQLILTVSGWPALVWQTLR
jgi:chitodextrinase